MCNGAWLVVSDVGRVSGMCVADRLLKVVLTAEAFTRVAKEFVELSCAGEDCRA